MTKILVIDDETATLSMFRLFLKAYGYEVSVAETGERALALFAKQKHPIVFTDIKMPGMDGLELLRRIKHSAPRTEVIVITGHGDMDLAVEALDLNATDFLNKPIRRQALEAALERAEARRKSGGSRNLRIAPEEMAAVTVLHLEGDLAAGAETLLQDAFAHAARKPGLVLHFSPVCALDRTGLDLLGRLLNECRQKGQTIALAGISENYKKIFNMTGIARMAEVFEDRETAVAHVLASSYPPTG